MKNINYENIKKIIEKNKENHLYIDEVINSQEIQKEVLVEYLSKNDLDNINNIVDSIKSGLVRTRLTDIEIVEYQSISNDDLIQDCNNLYIYNENKGYPICSISNIENTGENSKVVYEEFKVLDKDRKIVFLMKSSSKYLYGDIVQKQVILTEKTYSSNQYITKHYDFLYHNNECFMLTVDGCNTLIGNDSFNSRLTIALSHIQKLETIFESYIESSIGLDQPVKHYQIKRKIKKG